MNMCLESWVIFFIMGETFFSYLTALLRLYHLPFINIINGEKG